ncbi:MAG TPA: DUF983 domain-containing protein [Crenalkalicoccus sp.]|nr:DUF983 domain-containing protein [Crenalkalicoccus sp.]
MRWVPRPPEPPPYQPPPFLAAVGRGARGLCPVCGQGHAFRGYLKVAQQCEVCHAPLGRLRADDAPPYFTILLAGHLLVPGVLWVESAYQPPMWLHMAIWLPLFAIVCTLLLRPVKGAVLGWMTTLGFTGEEHGPPQIPGPPPGRG